VGGPIAAHCIYRPKNAIVRAAGSSLEKLIFDEDMVPALVVARFDRLARVRQPLPSGLLGTDRNRRVGRAEQRRSSARRHHAEHRSTTGCTDLTPSDTTPHHWASPPAASSPAA